MSEEEIEKLTVEQLAEEMMRCKLAAWEQIKNGESRMDDIEEALLHIQTDLKRSELQRTSYNEDLKADISELKDWFHKHGLDEMTKYDEIIKAVSELKQEISKTAEETDINTKLLAVKIREQEIEDEVKKRIEESHKDYNEYKKSAITALIVLSVGGFATILWSVIVGASK